MSETEAATDHQYWSVDSAPALLTRPLSVWAAPAVLLIFTMVAAVLMVAINLVPALVALFPMRDLVFSPYVGTHSVPLRIFIISFFVAYSCVVGAAFWGRVRFFGELSVYFVLICGALDVINLVAYEAFGLRYSLHLVEILSGLAGFFVFSFKLLDHGSMPKRVKAPYGRRFKRRSTVRLVLALLVAYCAAAAVDRLDLPLIGDLRHISLLGGTGPGVFLLLPIFFSLLYGAGSLQTLRRRKDRFTGAVTVIVPAHNEAHVIGRTIAAIDAAGALYAGSVSLLVLNNGSSDATAEIAQQALAAAAHITGRVVDVPTPGKAIALNRGIDAIDTDFVVRIDADTQVTPDSIARAMRHFARPDVGVVGGLPLTPGDGPFDRARTLEVLLKHGYYQVAYGALDAIVGVPGMFAAYRTDLVRAVGGFVQGMNGEDTDVSLRIGELGHRLVADPSVTYVSEVPRTYRHMREQRMRWFRSVYHVTARNRDYLDTSRFTLRGKVILPFMLVNSARRAMTVPLAIFGGLHLYLGVDPHGPLTVQAVLAVLLGAPALMASFAALLNGRPAALLGLPEYVLFRLLRSYLTLESVLSIAFAHDARTQQSSIPPAASSIP